MLLVSRAMRLEVEWEVEFAALTLLLEPRLGGVARVPAKSVVGVFDLMVSPEFT